MARGTKAVRTSGGEVTGVLDPHTGLQQFLGIAFAAPTGGSGRFRHPEPVAAWLGVFEATQFGPAAAHLHDAAEGTLEEFGESAQRGFVGDEGCLTLNIWTPAADEAARPVIVFVHGGANWVGSSRLPLYHGDKLSLRGDVVFVSFNYRLGMLGFMEFGAFGGPQYEGSHANGLRDQLAAIRWIRANIRAFGGDPDNVTLAGESAGSIDITWLLTNGHLEGLVRRVVLMSGVGGNRTRHDYSIEGGRSATRRFLGHAGITSMRELLRYSTAELLERHRVAFSKLHIFEKSMFTPRVDGAFIKGPPMRHAEAGSVPGIEVLIGFTAYEMGLYLLYDADLDRKTYAEQLANARIGAADRSSLIALYDELHRDEPQGVRGMHALSDIWYVMPSLLFAEHLARHEHPVWVYEFAWSHPGSRLRAAHALDLCFWFDKTDIHQSRVLLGEAATPHEQSSRERLARRMQDALLAFARTGNPNAVGADGPHWPAYDLQTRSVYRFDRDCSVVADPRRTARQWWSERQHLLWD